MTRRSPRASSRAPRAQVDAAELRAALDSALGEADAVGHRIVHGGERFREAVRIDARRRGGAARAGRPRAAAPAEVARGARRGQRGAAGAARGRLLRHRLPRHAPGGGRTYALPAEWRERWGLRRYGFHGLSHAWVARRAPELLGRAAAGLRIVSCHLGAGASLCAIADGRSLDTTMGFTPLEGLVMATRSGSVDPGCCCGCWSTRTCSRGELADALEHRSGLLGLAGSADMREVLARAERGDEPRAPGAGCLCAPAARRDRRDGGRAGRPRRARVHRRRRRALATRSGRGPRPGSGSSASQSTALATRRRRRTARSERDGAPIRMLVLTAREDIEIARQVRMLLSR